MKLLPEINGKRKLKWSDFYEGKDSDIFQNALAFQKFTSEEGETNSLLFRRPVLSRTENRVSIKDPETGKPRVMIMMGSNSYLALNSEPRVIEASVAAARKYGYGTGSVSLYTGTTDLHVALEERIARFYGAEAAILFPTGYAANIGTISGLLRNRHAALNDMFNHASIFDGCLLSGARIQTFAHATPKHMKRTLEKNEARGIGTLVITDGVFSMEGDIAPLDELCEIVESHGSRIMVDEAHALGVIGPTGRGTAELHDVQGKVDITVGTLSKLPGGIGGYVAGSKALIEYLRYYAKSYFYSTSIPAPVAAGLIEVFRILEEEPEHREALWSNINYMTDNLRAMGFDLGNTASAIVPIMVNDEDVLKRIAVDLHRAGIIMSYVAYPAVAKKRCRLRMSLMEQHTKEDMDLVLKSLDELGRKYGLIT